MTQPSAAQTNIRPMIEELLQAHPCDQTPLVLQLGDCSICVRTNHNPLVEALRAYFAEFLGEVDADKCDIQLHAVEAETPSIPFDFTVKKPDPGKTKIKEEYVNFADGRVVHKRLTGMRFFFTHDLHLGIGPCEANDNQVINFINNRYIQWLLMRDGLLCHASGIASPKTGQGIAFAGFSGMGKSTLSLHMMNQNLHFISNDRVIARQREDGLFMYGIPKHPRINPGTILNNDALRGLLTEEDKEAFGALPKEELWQLEHKYDAPIDVCYGPNRFHLHAPMRAFVILNWQRDGGETSFQKVDLRERTDLLVAVKKAPGLFFLPKPGEPALETGDEAYFKIFEKLDIYELSGGANFDQATAHVLTLFENE